jgi:hypothetical protein
MVVTEEVLTNIIAQYLNRGMAREELVDWAENMICHAEFGGKDAELLKRITGHLGLADVKEFGLSWDDCYNYLHELGHNITVTIS